MTNSNEILPNKLTDKELNELPDEYWKTPAKIVTDVDYLSEPTTPVESLELGEKIAAKLLYTLAKTKNGIALTANQIGISKSVFVVNVIRPMIFINPEVTGFSNDTLIYKETCLSLPGKKAKVRRHFNVKMKALNIENELFLGVNEEDYRISRNRAFLDRKLLECVAAQHEFDHTQGILITDQDLTLKPIVNEHKYGRNEKIRIVNFNDKEKPMKEIKFKHLPEWKKKGWSLVEELKLEEV